MTTAVKISKFQIYDILKSYHWKLKEIQRIDQYLTGTDFNGCAQYGIEAAMPTAQGIVGKALENEVIRRTEKSKRLNRYIEEVTFINERIHKVKDERSRVVLDCLLDGLSLTATSKHLGISRRKITEMRNDIVDALAEWT
ncbi:DNA-binding response regulator [Bacillus sp. NTK034]|uniref:DNA-binding response regulator n=1 Tax=Bacillus sp. NTK034 TaxID=2802176 RepID=UPI001A8F35A9|nr:DNA-binding response regulator [Bacillus sp. NTK034]MBN8200490.1 DNA-binding response regulator [Bacillus sp. NTK034]